MCMKLPPEDLNSDTCPSHSTSTYTYGVTIILRMCSGNFAKSWPTHYLIILFICYWFHTLLIYIFFLKDPLDIHVSYNIWKTTNYIETIEFLTWIDILEVLAWSKCLVCKKTLGRNVEVMELVWWNQWVVY